MDASILKMLMDYGVLGVICFVFLKQVLKLFKSRDEEFSKLLTTVMTEKKEPSIEIKNMLKEILQGTQKEHNNLSNNISELKNNIDDELVNKEDLINTITEFNKSIYEQRLENITLIKSYKMLLLDLKNTIGLNSSTRKIGEILISKGYITKDQLNEALLEQANDVVEKT